MTTTLKLTYEDYLYLAEDRQRHEIHDGVHVVTPAPSPEHQSIVMNLGSMLQGHLREHGLGRVLSSPVDVVLSETDVVQPDLIVLLADRLDRVRDTHIAGAPSLVIEVLFESTRRRDEITKRHLYALHGVEEYWIVDPVLESVKLYRTGEGGFELAAELFAESNDTLSADRLPGLAIDVVDIFA
ncbi:MAG TPA: Uma2 family endonuclease [Thermoanaerobaculia bacterium]|nr:Uma2 family endonuclease [Thermoanaerobaculia bacterium]